MNVEDENAQRGAPESENALVSDTQQNDNGGEDHGQEVGEHQPSDGDKPAPDGGKDQQQPKSKTSPALQRRIDELTRRNHDMERRWQESERQRIELEARQRVDDPNARQEPGQQPQQHQPRQQSDDVETRAQQIAAERTYNEQCNAVYDEGKKAFPDFDTALGNLKMIGALRQDVIEAAFASGSPHQVLYDLGNDVDEADRIARLSPVRMAVELAKRAAPAPKAAAPLSKTPAPIAPLQGSSRNESTVSDGLSDEEWGRRRDAKFK